MVSASTIKSHALSLGFDRCGIAPVGPFPELAFLDEWLRRGYAGTMSYLGRQKKKRRDLRVAEPGARSVIVTATVYNSDRPLAVERGDPTRAVVSRYAWGDDYHVLVRQRLDALGEWLHRAHGGPVYARSYVDTGPVQERVFAQYAGVGWIGKNSCVIDPELGSWLFLGCLITDLTLEPDVPMADQCGECTACLTACPTGALVAPATLDANRCISYLTIELKKAPPEPLRSALATMIYGCDICQDVCPWNRRAAVSDAPEWAPREGLDDRSLAEWWAMSDPEIEALIEGTPMTRAGVALLRRNLAIAIGNAAAHLPPDLLDRPGRGPRDSVTAPVVAECVEWARRQMSVTNGGAPLEL